MGPPLRWRLGRAEDGCLWRTGRWPAAGGRLPRQREQAGVQDPRPLRPSHRPGGIPPGLPRADALGHRAWPDVAAVDRSACRRPGCPCRPLLPACPGRGRQRLPADHDLRRRAGDQAAAGPRREVAAEDPRHPVRPAQRADGAEGRRHHRHGDDREAGRHRRARQHHARLSGCCQWSGPALRTGWAQVVLLGADVRRLPDPGADRQGPDLLPAAAPSSGRHAQRVLRAAPEEQAGQLVERLQRGGIPWRPGLDGRRGRPWRADHHRDGGDDPLRLHAWFQRVDAPGADPGRAPLRLPQGRWPRARRTAADAERARRPGAGKRSRAGPDHAHGPRPRPHARRAGGQVRPPGHRRGQVLDLQARPGDGQRGRRMHGRRRLRRGNHPAAAVPRGAGQFHLGRLRQRAVPGCAACPVEGARRARCAVQRTRRWPW
ncbi:hypothetical protein D3C78_630640 [compost metagenome]